MRWRSVSSRPKTLIGFGEQEGVAGSAIVPSELPRTFESWRRRPPAARFRRSKSFSKLVGQV